MMIALGYELPMIRYDTSCLNCARCLTLYLLPQPSLFPWNGKHIFYCFKFIF